MNHLGCSWKYDWDINDINEISYPIKVHLEWDYSGICMGYVWDVYGNIQDGSFLWRGTSHIGTLLEHSLSFHMIQNNSRKKKRSVALESH